MLYHFKSKEETLSALNVDSEKGLTSAKVNELKTKFGQNKLREKKKKGV